jgi:hypothetical protein
MTRSEFLTTLIGEQWEWQSKNCWIFAAFVQFELFGRRLPTIQLPDDPKWKWMVAEIRRHPERQNWLPVADGPHGLVQAADGALCLMGRFSGPGHVGVWLADLRKVIHCDRKLGVCLEDDLALKQQGWVKRTYFEPKEIT